METPYFQRLRRLSQLGLSVFVYPSATHNRFNHCLGAMELFVRLFNHLNKDRPKNRRYKELLRTGIAAVLLHDIGHGPVSHASENIFKFKHESLSQDIIKSESISSILNNANIDPDSVEKIVSHNAQRGMQLLSQLINSDLDVDRLDYVARDVYFTGVGFRIDLERIIRTMSIYSGSGYLKGYSVIQEKGLHVIESFMLTRSIMYNDVYYHKTTRCAEGILRKIFERVRELVQDKKLTLPLELAFMGTQKSNGGNTGLTVDDLMLLDDHVIYAIILKWSKTSDDTILKDLTNRFINRQLFKSVQVESKQDTQSFMDKVETIKELIRSELAIDPNYYCILDEPEERVYEPIRSPTNPEELHNSLRKNIFLMKREGFKEISSESNVIDILSKQKPVTRLFIPYQIRHETDRILNKPS